MDQYPGFFPIWQINLHQLIYQTPSQVATAGNFFQFLIQKFILAVPVNFRVNVRKKELQKLLEICIQHFFPDAILF
jgi:hypothetical protein